MEIDSTCIQTGMVHSNQIMGNLIPMESNFHGIQTAPKGFIMGKVDITLFTKKIGNDLFVLQIYVDDIIFRSTNQDFCEEFGKMMASEFEMSMIGELVTSLVFKSSK